MADTVERPVGNGSSRKQDIGLRADVDHALVFDVLVSREVQGLGHGCHAAARDCDKRRQRCQSRNERIGSHGYALLTRGNQLIKSLVTHIPQIPVAASHSPMQRMAPTQ